MTRLGIKEVLIEMALVGEVILTCYHVELDVELENVPLVKKMSPF